MSAELETRIDPSLEEGHLIIQNPNLYAVFQTAMPREESKWMGLPWYTYARIITNGIRLTRTEEGDHLIPQAEGPIDVQLRQNILVVPAANVDSVIDMLDPTAEFNVSPPSDIPAERLYQVMAGRKISTYDVLTGGETTAVDIELQACGTYTEDGELMIVDAKGGYSAGLSSREGIADDSDLMAVLPTAATQPVSQEVPIS